VLLGCGHNAAPVGAEHATLNISNSLIRLHKNVRVILTTVRLWTPKNGLLLVLVLALGGLTYLRAQRGRGGVFTLEGEFVPPPAGAEDETEFYFARLAYRTEMGTRWGPGAWMIDSPQAERHFLQGVTRLTTIHTNPMEVYLRATDPDLFNYPWLYVVEPGQWSLSDEEAAALREYLLRGGFMMTDDFHGTYEWTTFLRGMRKIFPDRDIVDIPASDPIFHNIYDITERFQIPGLQYLYSGSMCEMCESGGVDPHWRGIYDDYGRLMVIINFNMDLGDAWEHADMPQYAEKWTAAAYRFGINYVIYAMSH
jgi:hypothetical protein